MSFVIVTELNKVLIWASYSSCLCIGKFTVNKTSPVKPSNKPRKIPKFYKSLLFSLHRIQRIRNINPGKYEIWSMLKHRKRNLNAKICTYNICLSTWCYLLSRIDMIVLLILPSIQFSMPTLHHYDSQFRTLNLLYAN